MNFDEAIQAHVAWKITLRKMLSGTATLEHSPADSQHCAVGLWLKTQSPSKAAIAELTKLHAEFHHTAGEVVALAKSNRAKAGELLDGDFTQRSLKLVAALKALASSKEG